jgi:hypothetical protein
MFIYLGGGVQVISKAETHAHRVVTFVLYFTVENLATLIRSHILRETAKSIIILRAINYS